MNQSNDKQKYQGTSLKELKKTNKFYIPHVVAINNLHNIYFVTELSRNSIIKSREELIDEGNLDIEIEYPDIHGELKGATKNRSDTRKVLKNAIKHDLYSNSLISAVAATESFLEKLVKLCLLKDPRRLSQSIKKQGKKDKLSGPEIEVKIDDSTIPLRALLDAKCFEDLYSDIIQDKILQLMYASPSDYFGYLKNALSIEICDDVRDQYIEIKATRDLLTHADGYVNEIYIFKAGAKTRVTDLRQRIPLPPEYFSESIALMKRLVGDIYRAASAEFLGVTKNSQLFPNKRS